MSAGVSSDQRTKEQGMFGPSFGQQSSSPSSYNHSSSFPGNGDNFHNQAQWSSSHVNAATIGTSNSHSSSTQSQQQQKPLRGNNISSSSGNGGPSSSYDSRAFLNSSSSGQKSSSQQQTNQHRPQQSQSPPQSDHSHNNHHSAQPQKYRNDNSAFRNGIEHCMQAVSISGGGGARTPINQRNAAATSTAAATAAKKPDTAKDAPPKQMTWASIASQPAKPQIRTNTSTSILKKKGPGMPPPPMVPGKHNMDISTWDQPANGPAMVPPPPLPVVPPPIDPSEPSPLSNAHPLNQPHKRGGASSSRHESGDFRVASGSLNRHEPRDRTELSRQSGYNASSGYTVPQQQQSLRPAWNSLLNNNRGERDERDQQLPLLPRFAGSVRDDHNHRDDPTTQRSDPYRPDGGYDRPPFQRDQNQQRAEPPQRYPNERPLLAPIVRSSVSAPVSSPLLANPPSLVAGRSVIERAAPVLLSRQASSTSSVGGSLASGSDDRQPANSGRPVSPPQPPATISPVPVEHPVLEELCVKNKYNPDDFDFGTCRAARFFVIKSYSEDDIHRSIKYEIWCSTDHGNRRLDQAFHEREAAGGIVYLLFSVNGSGHFCGMAQMLTAVDYNSVSSVWSQSKWKGTFRVKWVYVKDVPNTSVCHIRLENNENKAVTYSRDTQEVPNAQGIQVVRIIDAYKHVTSIFDDFVHYEQRQKEEDTKKVSANAERPGYERRALGGHYSRGGGYENRRRADDGAGGDYNRGGNNRDDYYQSRDRGFDRGGGDRGDRGFDRGGGDRGDRGFDRADRDDNGRGFQRNNRNDHGGGSNNYRDYPRRDEYHRGGGFMSRDRDRQDDAGGVRERGGSGGGFVPQRSAGLYRGGNGARNGSADSPNGSGGDQQRGNDATYN